MKKTYENKMKNLKKHLESKSDYNLIKKLKEYDIEVTGYSPGESGSINIKCDKD